MNGDPITDLVSMVGDAIGGLTEAMAKAWDEGYGAGELCGLTAEQSDHACPINPYRSEDAA